MVAFIAGKDNASSLFLSIKLCHREDYQVQWTENGMIWWWCFNQLTHARIILLYNKLFLWWLKMNKRELLLWCWVDEGISTTFSIQIKHKDYSFITFQNNMWFFKKILYVAIDVFIPKYSSLITCHSFK